MQKLGDIPGKWRQMLAAIVVNLASCTIGVSYGWTSVVVDNFQDANNTLGIEPMTEDEISWLSSTMPLSQLLILPFASSLCERFGRKNVGIIEAVTFSITWLLRLFSTNFYVFIIAQALSGVSDTLCSLVIPLYITETASDAIRGQLGSFYFFGIQSGYLFTLVLATVLSYKIMIGCALIVPILHLIGMILLPETPVYLIRKNRNGEAARALMWLRGNDTVAAESDQLKIQQFHQKITHDKISFGVKDFFTDRTNFKSMIITIAMITFQQLTGISIMMIYIMRIIDEVKSPLDPYIASVIYGSAQLVGCFLSSLTVDRLGRRPLLLLSTSSMAVCHAVLGVFFLLQSSGYGVNEYSWLPIAAATLFGFSFTAGFGPLVSVVCNEVFNPELATIGNCILVFSYSVLTFILLKFFPLVTNVIGFHNCFFIFVLTCVSGFFVLWFLIPETKGKSIETIRVELQKTNKKKDDGIEESATK